MLTVLRSQDVCYRELLSKYIIAAIDSHGFQRTKCVLLVIFIKYNSVSQVMLNRENRLINTFLNRLI